MPVNVQVSIGHFTTVTLCLTMLQSAGPAAADIHCVCVWYECHVDNVDSVGDDDEEQQDVTNINRKAKMNKQVATAPHVPL